MKQSAKVKEVLLLACLLAIVTLIFTGTALAADAISLQASEPATIYYTTSGADPSVTTTYTNYYVAEGTKITQPTAISFTDTPLGASERISLVPNAGRGRPYVKPEKLKIHESKKEFEKHVKQKHGKRFKIFDFSSKQTENGLEGHIFLVENKNSDILQLGRICTDEERTRRIAAIKEFIINNPELIGVTDNEELREKGLERNYCASLYFNRYINGYELQGSVFHFGFEPQWNFSISVDLDTVLPEMYLAAQQDALTPEEIAKIVYRDLNITINENAPPPKLVMRKYLRNREPYVIWNVREKYIYEINALTGEIVFKQLNVKY